MSLVGPMGLAMTATSIGRSKRTPPAYEHGQADSATPALIQALATGRCVICNPSDPEHPGYGATSESLGTMVQSAYGSGATNSPTRTPAHQVPTGPAGRAMAQPMDGALLEGLQQHLTMERQASAAYWAMAIWFAERELRGFCYYLKGESGNEQHHAGLIADYLVARGQSVPLDTLTAPHQQWRDAEEIFGAIFQMEADVTTSLQQLYAMAERTGDVRTTVFLDPMVQGQIDSENEAAHLLGRIRFAQGNPAAMLMIDGELSNDQHTPGSVA